MAQGASPRTVYGQKPKKGGMRCAFPPYPSLHRRDLCHQKKSPPNPPLEKGGIYPSGSKEVLKAPQWGQLQELGRSSKAVPGWDVAHGVALGRVVNIATDGAAIFLHGEFLLEVPGIIPILFYTQKPSPFEDKQEKFSGFFIPACTQDALMPPSPYPSPRNGWRGDN